MRFLVPINKEIVRNGNAHPIAEEANDKHTLPRMHISTAGSIEMGVRDEVIGRSAISAVCVLAMLSGGDQASAQSASSDRPADHSIPVALDAITIGAERKKTQAPSASTSSSVVSTTTLSADRIGVDRIDSVQRALDATPNAVFNPQGGPIAIRGIGSLGRTGGVDRRLSVGVFLDDVYIGRPYGIPDHLYGLERIDVVRGPQVTRYGWSTLGGAFNLMSPAPATKAGASVEGSVSSYGIARAATTLDAPMIPGSLGAHAFFSYGRGSGYVTNDYNGDKILGGENVVGRMSVQGQSGDATMLRLNFDYFHTHDDGDIVLSRVEDALRGHSRYNFPQYCTNDIGGVSARLTHSFDGFDLTSISAFRAFYYDFNLDGEFTSTPFFLQGERQEQQQASQELRPTSTLDGPMSWMAGATYMFEHFKAQQFFGLEAAPSAPDRSRLDQTSSTISGFGQLGWK
jgi:iron complex outermembrane receptor protein